MEGQKKKLNILLIVIALIVIAALVFAIIKVMPKGSGSATTVLDNVKISLDDEAYTIDSSDKVIIPAGRPRVPQILCDNPDVEIYQAFFPDEAQTAEAVLRLGNEERRITFIKDSSLGLEFQYDDRIQWAGDIPNATYTSSNPKVAKVTLAGQIIITGVSDEPVTLKATNGLEEEEFTITRTIKAPIGVYLLTGQSNAAYYFAEPDKASKTKKGTAYVFDISGGNYAIQSMNNDDDSQARGNVDAGIAKSIYDGLGEKVLIVNTGLSGEKIETFEPGGTSYNYTFDSWKNVEYIFNTDWFKERFEPRIRSYLWVQGESDDWASPEEYMESFMSFHDTLRSEKYGFDYAFISSIVPRFFRPNDAQERLAQGYDDIFMGTRVTGEFSVETGEMRTDNLHYTQYGDNRVGEDLGHSVALVYTGHGNEFLEGEEL